MLKYISFLIFKLFLILDKILLLIFKKGFLLHFKNFIEKNLYKEIKILNNNIKFFIPSPIIAWRVDTFYSKEPETLEWINSFEKKNIVFWDIGANIGLYSIYNSLKNPNSTTISFEPSTSNLRTLSRNISLNNLEKKIKIFPLPLSNKKNLFLEMKEGDFNEGAALNTFGENFNFEGKNFKSENKYHLFGTTIDFLINQKILAIPDYIKIDVDGIEHLILYGATNCLKEKKVKSLSIEINESFEDQLNSVLKIMNDNNFVLKSKKNNSDFFDNRSKFAKVFNYIFVRRD